MLNYRNNKKGFTLIEVAIAGVIFTILAIGIFRFLHQVSITTFQDRNKIKADNFAQQLLEETKASSGVSFETLETLSSNSITRPEFPGLTATRSVGAINSSGEREIRVNISWQEGSNNKQSNYYLKLVKGSVPSVGGIVTGYVKDNAGNGIEGATVWAPNILIEGSDITATTDVNGFFTLTKVRTGTQPITAQKLGSSPTNINFEQGYYNNTDYSWNKTVNVLVKVAESIVCPDIVLDPLGYITGNVIDAYDGATIIDNIRLKVYFNWGSQTRWWEVYTDTSNLIPPFGHTYIIRNVMPPRPGNYYWVSINRKNGSLYTVQEQDPAFEWGYCALSYKKIMASDFIGDPLHATFSPLVERLGWLKGKITDAITTLPVANAIVEADPHTDGALYGYSVITDSNGNYAYYNMYERNRNKYSSNPPIYASKAGYLKGEQSIAVKKNQLNICNIALYPSDCIATVIGTIQIEETEGPPRLATENEVQIYAERFDSTYTSRKWTYAWTKADGTYELNDVRPNFDPTEKRRIYLKLPGGIKGDIQGFIYEDIIGIGLGGATVYSNTSFGSHTDISDTSGATGFYELKNVREIISTSKNEYLPPDPPPPNKVIVDCTLNTSKVSVRVNASKSEYNSTYKNVYLINNGTTELNLILTKKDICYISGAITDSKTGNGVVNITVRSEGKSAITDTNGNYTISSVPIGLDGIVTVTTDATNDYESGYTSISEVNPGDILTDVNIAIDPKYSGM